MPRRGHWLRQEPPARHGDGFTATGPAADRKIPRLVVTATGGATFTSATRCHPATAARRPTAAPLPSRPTTRRWSTRPADKTIPTRTPFTLTGSATDANGDALTYLWEQTDAGGAAGTSLSSNTKANGPLFRVFGVSAQVSEPDSLDLQLPG